MKKMLLLVASICTATLGQMDAVPFGQLSSYSEQVIDCNQPVTFEFSNLHELTLHCLGKSISFDERGTYLFSYTAVGSAYCGSPTSGTWCLSLLKNNENVDQSQVCVTSTDSNERIEAVGQALVEIRHPGREFVQLVACGPETCCGQTFLQSINLVITRVSRHVNSSSD